MQFCTQCNIKLQTSVINCPLCNKKLTFNKSSLNVEYPIINYNKYVYIYKKFLVLLICFFCYICFMINYTTSNKASWSIFVILFSIYIYISFINNIKKQRNIGLLVTMQSFYLSILLFYIDILTGFLKWSTNYAIPIIFFIAILFINSILIARPFKISDYIIYLIVLSIFGVIPFILFLFSLSSVYWPSILVLFYSLLTIIGMFKFINCYIKSELKKRFHF